MRSRSDLPLPLWPSGAQLLGCTLLLDAAVMGALSYVVTSGASLGVLRCPKRLLFATRTTRRLCAAGVFGLALAAAGVAMWLFYLTSHELEGAARYGCDFPATLNALLAAFLFDQCVCNHTFDNRPVSTSLRDQVQSVIFARWDHLTNRLAACRRWRRAKE